MAEIFPYKEYIQKQNIENLHILIHPFYVVSPEYFESDYLSARKNLQEIVLQDFVPKKRSDVTLFIPNYISSVKDYLDDSLKTSQALEKFPMIPQWTEVYKRVRQQTLYPKNVLLGPNFISGISVTSVEERLRKKGFLLQPNTFITLGGEWENDCVEKGLNKLLLAFESSGKVGKISLDKEATIHYDEFLDDNSFSRYTYVPNCTFDVAASNWSMSRDTRYISFEKNT